MVPMMSLLYARSCDMLMTELFPDIGSFVIWWWVHRRRDSSSTEGVGKEVRQSPIFLNHHEVADGRQTQRTPEQRQPSRIRNS